MGQEGQDQYIDADGVVIEDVLAAHERRKAKRAKIVNTKKKGDNFEVKVCGMLAEAYGERFGKTPGSGGMATSRKLDPIASEVLSGDLMVGRLGFTIECKKGYDDIEVLDFFADASERTGRASKSAMREFIQQAERESKKSGKELLIIWAKTRKAPVACMRRGFYDMVCHFFPEGHTVLHYDGYSYIPFTDFLKIPKHIVFSADPKASKK